MSPSPHSPGMFKYTSQELRNNHEDENPGLNNATILLYKRPRILSAVVAPFPLTLLGNSNGSGACV
jgi:hypothetical protein